jgi:hypothetical protein
MFVFYNYFYLRMIFRDPITIPTPIPLLIFLLRGFPGNRFTKKPDNEFKAFWRFQVSAFTTLPSMKLENFVTAPNFEFSNNFVIPYSILSVSGQKRTSSKQIQLQYNSRGWHHHSILSEHRMLLILCDHCP